MGMPRENGVSTLVLGIRRPASSVHLHLVTAWCYALSVEGAHTDNRAGEKGSAVKCRRGRAAVTGVYA
jgi:hypothetical protein